MSSMGHSGFLVSHIYIHLAVLAGCTYEHVFMNACTNLDLAYLLHCYLWIMFKKLSM